MKLLIITQKVDKNDPVLGFFHQWLVEFSKQTEKVFVICLYEGEHSLPDNVTVFSLGKEKGESRLGYVVVFYKILWKLRGTYDAVFVHMNQVYVVLAGLYWRATRTPVSLWYLHRAKTFSLWIAEKFTNIVFTNTDKSFTIPSKKVVPLGHGIDIAATRRPDNYDRPRDNKALISVGRLTPIKDQETILRACGMLIRSGVSFSCTFIGGPATASDDMYVKKLTQVVSEEGGGEQTSFIGNVPQTTLFPHYWKSGVHINACPTGGMDKVVLEAAAGGAIPIVSNESFRNFLSPYAERLIFKAGDAASLADTIKKLLASNDQEEIRTYFIKKTSENFDVTGLVKKIVGSLSSLI